MLIDKRIWQPSEGVRLPQEVLDEIVKNTSQNIAILAGPGTGKTELLAQRASFLLETGQCPSPQKILALCFKVDAAANIQQRVEKRCGNVSKSRFISSTFDSFFISIVRRFSIFLPDWINAISPDFEVGDFKDIKHLPTDLNLLTDIKVQDVINECVSQNKLHWSICRKLAYTIIKNSSEVRNLISVTYKFVFLDEFQDATTDQYEFIKQVFNTQNNIITTVGDNNQMIMRWAGADTEVFNKFRQDFNAEIKQLNINHRSNKNIVDFINYIAEQIKLTDEETVKYFSTRKAISEHCVFWAEYTTKENEAETIAQYIQQEITSNSNLTPSDFALIIRQKAGDYYNVANGIFSTNGLLLRNEDELVIENGIAIQALMDEPLSNFFVNLIRKKEDIITPEQNQELFNTLAFLKNLDISNERKYIKLLGYLNELINLIANYDQTSIWTNKIAKKIGRNNLKRIRSLSNESDFIKVKLSFDELFQQSYNETQNAEDAISKFLGENQVKLMTVHKSKGLEFHTVFFVDFNANAWWALSNAAQGKDVVKLKEEQNVFFVGASRAKENLIFTNGAKGQWPHVIVEILNKSKALQEFKV